MSTIRLSAPAIMKMMEAGDEGRDFRLEMQKYVVQEVVKQLLPKDLEKATLDLINAAIKVEAKEIVATGDQLRSLNEIAVQRVKEEIAATQRAYGSPKLSPEKKTQIGEAVDRAITAAVREHIETKTGTISEITERMTNAILDRTQTSIAREVEKRVEAGVAQMIDGEVTRRLQAIKDALAA